jgi:hypothetical protein
MPFVDQQLGSHVGENTNTAAPVNSVCDLPHRWDDAVGGGGVWPKPASSGTVFGRS